MAKRQRKERTEPTRKETAMTRKEREQARRVTIIVGIALGLAALVLLGGLVYQFLIVPNSSVAKVGDQSISASDLAERSKFQHLQTESQLSNLIQLDRQFSADSETGSVFGSQIAQLQSTLANPDGLSNQVLEEMIDEEVIRQAAAELGIVVGNNEVQQGLEELIASQMGAVTVPQATATAEALAVATPTPSAEVSDGETVETPLPSPTTQVLDADGFTENFNLLIENVSGEADLSSGQVEGVYRSLITLQLLREKLLGQLGDEMPKAGEQVSARHILILLPEDASEGDEQQALASAIEISQRLKDGEDFAELAAEFSEDTSNAENGGDLGFFGRGRMVPEFEEAAFSLPIGEISDPVRTVFGYHIIRVDDFDEGQPDFNGWLVDQKVSRLIERNLTDSLLPNLPETNPALLGGSANPLAPIAPPPAQDHNGGM